MTLTTETATIGHNSATVGEMIKEDPAVIFRDEGLLPSLIKEIEAEIGAHEVDLETDKGRKAVASLAFGIAKQKTAIDAAGKDLNEDHRKAISRVDAIRRDVRVKLDDLRDVARKPLTEWEQREKERAEYANSARLLFKQATSLPATTQLGDIDVWRDKVKSIDVTAEAFGSQLEQVQAEQDSALTAIAETESALKKAEEERIELERLRAEAAKKEAAEREAREKAEAERLERERIEAAERRAAEAAAAEERRKAQESIDAANREREEAAKALEAEREKAAAAKRAEEEAKAKAEREAAEREADQKHRSSVMKAAKEAIMDHGGVDEESAKKIVLAIVAGSVPAVTLRF